MGLKEVKPQKIPDDVILLNKLMDRDFLIKTPAQDANRHTKGKRTHVPYGPNRPRATLPKSHNSINYRSGLCLGPARSLRANTMNNYF